MNLFSTRTINVKRPDYKVCVVVRSWSFGVFYSNCGEGACGC